MEEEEFISTLLTLTQEEDISLSFGQARLCCEHALLMLEWNRRTNLTRITDSQEIIIKHFLDSFIPARWLPSRGLTLDVGAGAGFPGIPLWILHPELGMVLLEIDRKKVSFLKVLLSRFQRDNLWALRGRWEEFLQTTHPLGKQPYDLVVMRAVEIEEEHLTHLASNILKPGGFFAYWAGPRKNPPIKSSEFFHKIGCMVFENCYTYKLPFAAGLRQLFVWKRLPMAECNLGEIR